MPVMLERWNDDRMDDLAAKVDGIGEELREQRRETREEMRELRQEMKAAFVRIDERFAKLERTMTQAAIALSSSVIVGFGALLAAQL